MSVFWRSNVKEIIAETNKKGSVGNANTLRWTVKSKFVLNRFRERFTKGSLLTLNAKEEVKNGCRKGEITRKAREDQLR